MSNPDPPSRSDVSWDVAVTSDNGILTAAVMHPSVGETEASAIHGRVHRALADAGGGLTALVFDLSAVTFMNSMGVGMCIDLRNRAEERGARTFIIGLSAELRRLFKTVRIEELFTLVDSADAVRRKLK